MRVAARPPAPALRKPRPLAVKPRAASPVVAAAAASTEKDGNWLKDKALPAIKGAFGKVSGGMMWLIFGIPMGDFKSRKFVEDRETRWGDDFARTDYLTARAEELAAVARLGSRATAYQALADRLEHEYRDYPARRALQKMLLDGRLTEAPALRGGQDALHHLLRLNEDSPFSGAGKAQQQQYLITDLIEEMEHPAKIGQGPKGTCAVTAATILLARENPAEYARLIADLASAKGETVLADGTRAQRDAHWEADARDWDDRTYSVRLLQPALMELGNGMSGYDNQKDVHNALPFLPVWGTRILGGAIAILPLFLKTRHWAAQLAMGAVQLAGGFAAMKSFASGLSMGGTAKVSEALTGKDHDAMSVHRLNKEKFWKRFEADLAAGKPVEVGMIGPWGGPTSAVGGHAVIASKLEGGQVSIINPWGQEERMGAEEFKARVMGASFRVG